MDQVQGQRRQRHIDDEGIQPDMRAVRHKAEITQHCAGSQAHRKQDDVIHFVIPTVEDRNIIPDPSRQKTVLLPVLTGLEKASHHRKSLTLIKDQC